MTFSKQMTPSSQPTVLQMRQRNPINSDVLTFEYSIQPLQQPLCLSHSGHYLLDPK